MSTSADGVPGGWIPVGRLHRTRGNRGELQAEFYSSQPGRAEKLKEVKLETGARSRSAVIEQLWYHDGRPVLKFAGIDSISDAEVWQGADILVPEAERALPAEGEYSHADLIGCTVLDGGVEIGVVGGVEEFGGPALLSVTAKDGREVLIPFVHAICREIDVSAKVIRAELPEGLLEQ